MFLSLFLVRPAYYASLLTNQNWAYEFRKRSFVYLFTRNKTYGKLYYVEQDLVPRASFLLFLLFLYSGNSFLVKSFI